jgi:hypothetical protein
MFFAAAAAMAGVEAVRPSLWTPSSCVHVRRPGARWGPGATFTAAGLQMVGASKEASWPTLVPARVRRPSSASKLGAKLWSALLLRAAAVASVNM